MFFVWRNPDPIEHLMLFCCSFRNPFGDSEMFTEIQNCSFYMNLETVPIFLRPCNHGFGKIPGCETLFGSTFFPGAAVAWNFVGLASFKHFSTFPAKKTKILFAFTDLRGRCGSYVSFVILKKPNSYFFLKKILSFFAVA